MEDSNSVSFADLRQFKANLTVFPSFTVLTADNRANILPLL